MSSSHELTVGLQNKTRSLDSMHWNECIQDPFIQLQENVHVLVFILSSEVVPPDQHSWGTGLLEALFSYLPAGCLLKVFFFPLVTSCCKGAGCSVDYRSSLQRESRPCKCLGKNIVDYWNPAWALSRPRAHQILHTIFWAYVQASG
jgi:hypothetical protein